MLCCSPQYLQHHYEYASRHELTVYEFAGVVEEVGHKDPVNHHRPYQRHQRENQAGQLATFTKVILAHVREFPIGCVDVG